MVKFRRNNITIFIVISIVSISIGLIFYLKIIIDKNESNELEGTITFVSNRTDKKNEIEELIEVFEAINPKVKIELELIGDAESILYRRAIVDDLPDITLIPGEINVSDYNKYFLSLEDLGFDSNDIYNYYTGVGSDNKLYNLTTSISWTGIIYNKKIFEEANIEDIPTTNEEFLEVCEKIKALGKIPIALNYKESWTMNQWIDVIPNILNPSLESEVFIENKGILEEESSLFKSLEILREIVQNNYCEDDLLNYGWQNCKNDIKDGKVAMFLGSSALMYQLEDIGMNADHIGIFPFVGSNNIYVFGEYRFGIAKNTKYPEIAKEFLKFIFEKDRYANAVNILSPLKESEQDNHFFEELKSFNIPIEIYGESLVKYDEVTTDTHEQYESLKKSIGINYSFAQLYSICNNPEEIVNDMNEKWKKEKTSLD